jgi:hypothetical protein
VVDKLIPTFFAPGVQCHLIALEEGNEKKKDDFERCFYYSLLLQPPLAMIDTAFFIVDEIEQQLTLRKKLGSSWLEAAVDCGALLPIFRSGANFSENLQGLRANRFAGLSDRSEDIARLLDSAIKKPLDFPTMAQYRLGHSLGVRLRQFYLAENPPIIIPTALPEYDRIVSRINEFWSRTKEWRERWIEESSQVRPAEDGIRLSDLYHVAAKTFSSGNPERISSGWDLVRLCKEQGADNQRLIDLRRILILMDLLYQRNFNQGMTAANGTMGLTLPRWHRIAAFFDLGILPESEQDAPLISNDFDSLDVLTDKKEIKLPTLKALRRTPGYVFKAIWNEGEKYRIALHHWRMSPNASTFSYLADELGPYSQIINQKVRADSQVGSYWIGPTAQRFLPPILTFATGAAVFCASLNYDASPFQKDVIQRAATNLLPTLVILPLILRKRQVRATLEGDEIVVGRGQSQISLTNLALR